MSDDTFTRRFHGDRADLAKVGIEIRVLDRLGRGRRRRGPALPAAEEDFRLPEVGFTPAELTALSMALAALDGRFAYARPLRLALTAICHGTPGRARPSSSDCCRSPWRPTRTPARPASSWPGWRTPWPEAGPSASPTPAADPASCPARADRRPVQPVLHPGPLVRRGPGPSARRRADLPGHPHRGAGALPHREEPGLLRPRRLRPRRLSRPSPLAAGPGERHGHHQRGRRPGLVRGAAGPARPAAPAEDDACARFGLPYADAGRAALLGGRPGRLRRAARTRRSSAPGCWKTCIASAQSHEGPPEPAPAGVQRDERLQRARRRREGPHRAAASASATERSPSPPNISPAPSPCSTIWWSPSARL